MKISRILLSMAILTTLSNTVYSSDDDRMGMETGRSSKSLALSSSEMPTTSLKAEAKSETKQVQSSRPGFLKTLMMGALMFSSPIVVEAQNPGFVGCYTGMINKSGISNNISINYLSTTNWNSYYIASSFDKSEAWFYPLSANLPQFNFNIECEKQSYCKDFYIKSSQFCGKIFDINYYASMKFDPLHNNSWSNFYLAVWDSLSPNNTLFDQYFSGYLRSTSSGRMHNCSFASNITSTSVTPSSLAPTTTAPAPTPQKQNPPYGAVI